MQNITPMVSICCQTYNHKDYIIEALEGFLMQKTNFPFEILLRDDASTDGTAEICREYAQNHPNIIKLLAYEENQWSKGVSPFRDNVKRAKGKYIAMCEGDDYWTDPLKLQKQVDFLESNPDYSFVSASTTKLLNNKEYPFLREETDIELNNMLKANVLGSNTCVLLFRSNLINDAYYQNSINAVYGDWSLYLHLLQYGKGKLLSDIMGTYRVHDGGVWSSLSEDQKLLGTLKMFDFIEKTYPDYKTTVDEGRHVRLQHYKSLILKKSKQEFEQSRKIIDIKLFLRRVKGKLQLWKNK